MFFSAIELKFAEILSEHPERENDPTTLFEEISDVGLEGKVNVHFHKCDNTHFNFLLPPSPEAIQDLLHTNKSLGNYFRKMFVDRTEAVNDDDILLQQLVAERAWSDKEFMQQLKTDPSSVFNQVTGSEIKDKACIKLYENSATDIHINIPPPQISGGALSESDLAGVAGGVSGLEAMANAIPYVATHPKETLENFPEAVENFPGNIERLFKDG